MVENIVVASAVIFGLYTVVALSVFTDKTTDYDSYFGRSVALGVLWPKSAIKCLIRTWKEI